MLKNIDIAKSKEEPMHTIWVMKRELVYYNQKVEGWVSKQNFWFFVW